MFVFNTTLAEPQHFSLAEKIIFAGLAIASAYGFWRRFGPILNKILRSKKDPGFHLFPIGKRVWDFFWEVLCQGKVIRERPLPGLAHALVFWAFCAFALVTLNHCAIVLGIGFLDPSSGIGRLYYYLCRRLSLIICAGEHPRTYSSAASWSDPNGWASEALLGIRCLLPC
jgi:hypothetical protein